MSAEKDEVQAHRRNPRAATRSPPTPAAFLGVIAGVLVVWVGLARLAPESEVGGVGLSVLTASAAWLAVRRWWRVEAWAGGAARTLDLMLAAKVAIGLLHFYLVFAPAAGIQSASDLRFASIAGDLPPIDQAARTFASVRAEDGILEAFAGDFDRRINNAGVGAVYGLLYGAFGPYATVAIPWNALAMGLAALALLATGRILGAPEEEARFAAVSSVLLPTFFVAPPLYRDQFLVLLIALTAYASLRVFRKPSLAGAAALAALAVLLGSLRAPLLMLPVVALAATALSPMFEGRPGRSLLLSVGVAALVVFAANWVPTEWVAATQTRMVDASGRGPVGIAGSVFGANIFAKVLFLLLTPMPWDQVIPSWLLAHQVFDYAETVVSLTVILAIGMSPLEALRGNRRVPLLLLGGALFAMALFAEELHQRYFQIALPLVMLGGAPVIRKHWRAAATGALGTVFAAHLFIWVAR